MSRDLSGVYQVHIGGESQIGPVRDERLPRLKASVGAFSRLWLGVSPATSLSVTDDLHAPADLLTKLDDAFRLPKPAVDWDF